MALYARRWWLGEDSASLRRAERRTTGRIAAVQKHDGSFGGLATTIRLLFALHLLQRQGSHESDRAIDWLWEAGQPRQEAQRIKGGVVYHDLLTRMRLGEASRLRRMAGTPFTSGCSIFVKTACGIFLASVFGRGREARVQRAIRCLDEVIEAKGTLWCTPTCSANLLKAYAAHPDGGRGLARAVRALGRMQGTSGSWPGMPFVPTFNALASIDLRDARAQVRRALPVVRRTQNADGSWGRGSNSELTTFQVVEALRRIEA